ncbi:hypothetical protein BBD42_04820 [Paenibacillus sp. BIHB 4019]|uniref:Uncharacterized protein n=1 Tax=Paenibacillus sp. BIHB 4019 TaxID=1870819 RepID=A0A1B2DDS2_9BACL|nr:hypothetical protein [Paenibacillus sp. BIHB 4019]ANY65864.1 hypothetical protein BBD42_04820 [Paenibacillus sp. BIHB 4019]
MLSCTVSVTNEASYSANICLFQLFPELKDPTARTYIWLAAPSKPFAGSTQFTWEPKYQFMWRTFQDSDSQGASSVGAVEYKDATLWRSNAIVLLKAAGGSYYFSQPYEANDNEHYYMKADRTVDPADKVRIGLGQSSRPIMTVEAHPNTLTGLQSNPVAYMVYGHWQTGQVIEPEMYMQQALELNFSGKQQLNVHISSSNQLHLA